MFIGDVQPKCGHISFNGLIPNEGVHPLANVKADRQPEASPVPIVLTFVTLILTEYLLQFVRRDSFPIVRHFYHYL